MHERLEAAGPARGRGEGGFTLMEILIALVVLMVGLVGLMAVFPQAMLAANTTVNLSYASAISQSVIDAVELGLRESRLQTSDGRWQAFILDHDGPEDLDGDRNTVLAEFDLENVEGSDGAPTQAFRDLLRRDYCILLPHHEETVDAPGGGRPVGAMYHYPRAEPGEGGRPAGHYAIETWEVGRVYELGRHLAESEHEDPLTREAEQADAYQDYSFAFTIAPASAATTDNPSLAREQQDIVPGLYELVVRVFRSFEPQHRRLRRPVAEFTTYVSAR